MIEQASLVIGEGNWAVKSDSLLGYKINGGKYYPREMSVVRATTGTRINEDGLVELVPYNLLSYSEQFDNAAWVKESTVTVTPNVEIAPDGTLTADLINMPINRSMYQTFSIPAGEAATASVYIKGAAGETINFAVKSGNFTKVLTGEWQRIEQTSTGSGTVFSVNRYSGGTASSFYLWGYQLVEGSSALDYLPTTDRLDVARIDYSSGSGALLVEPQRTNLAVYSEQFDNANYTKLNSSITANASISPSGILNADKLVENTANTFHLVGQTRSLSVGIVAYSFYAKQGGRSSLRIDPATSGLAPIAHTFNLANGTSVGGFIEPAANGFFRCSGTFEVLVAGTRGIFIVLLNSSGVTNYLGDGVSGAFLWGLQYEVGSYSTSYIPTQSATVTRNADAISKTGIADLIGQTEGTLFVEFINDNNNNASIARIIALSDGTANNRLYLAKLLSGASYFVSVASGTQTGEITGSIMPQGIVKIALAYNTNDVVMYVNGSLVGSDLFHTTPATSNLYLGQENLGTASLCKPYNAVALYKTRLTNAELATLTTI